MILRIINQAIPNLLDKMQVYFADEMRTYMAHLERLRLLKKLDYIARNIIEERISKIRQEAEIDIELHEMRKTYLSLAPKYQESRALFNFSDNNLFDVAIKSITYRLGMLTFWHKVTNH